MIKQIVLLKFKKNTPQDKINTFINMWKKLKSIEGVLSLDIFENISKENLDKGFTIFSVIEFENDSAEKAYLENAEHKLLVKNVLTPILEDLIILDGIDLP